MSVFISAIEVLFNNKHLTVSATFMPQLGESKAVRVLTRTPDVYQNVGQAIVETPSLVLEVQTADCASVQAGDRFMLEAVTYIVQGEPRRDSDQLYWQVDCYAS